MRELFQREVNYRLGDFEYADEPASCADCPQTVLQLKLEAENAFRQGEYAKAATLAREATIALRTAQIRGSPLLPMLWEIRADAYARLQLPRKAIRCGKALLSLILANGEKRMGNSSLALAHLGLGHYHYEAGHFASALQHYLAARSCLEKIGTCHQITEIMAQTQAALADCLANLGDLDNSLTACENLIALLESDKSICFPFRRLIAAREQRAFYLAWMGRCDSAALESEKLIGALRHSLQAEPELETDLARCLDHAAEILERSHRLEDALCAACESVDIRRRLAQKNPECFISYLRSVITQARLAGSLGNTALAITLCEEAEEDARKPGRAKMPADLLAQFLACHGQNLMKVGQRTEGEKLLFKSARLFRHLAGKNKQSVYGDAYSETLFDIGKHHLKSDPPTARHFLLRCAARKNWVARESGHDFHQTSLVEILCALGKSQMRCGNTEASRRTFRRAAAIVSQLETSPGNFPAIASRLTLGLIATAQPCENLEPEFRLLAKAYILHMDLADATLKHQALTPLKAFQCRWLEYFIADQSSEGIVSLLAFAHGRRLSMLTSTELECRQAEFTFSPIEQEFLTLRHRLREIDLEMASILSSRPRYEAPEKNPTEPSVWPNLRVNVGNSQEAKRKKLFDRFIELRDRLSPNAVYPGAPPGFPDIAELRTHLPENAVILIWCIPEVFNIDQPPLLLVVTQASAKPVLLSAPEIGKAHRNLLQLQSGWHFARATTRGGNFAGLPTVRPLDIESLEMDLWQDMEKLWQRIETVLPGNTQAICMVTHAQAHNLPWLGSCPEHLDLHHFPSLHQYLRNKASNRPALPSHASPLALIVEEGDTSDPAEILYHASIEAELIGRIWPDATLRMESLEDPRCRQCSCIWMIGHGITRFGQPRFGHNTAKRFLAETSVLRNPGDNIGLIFASACHLGQISDIDGEPVGLASLSAIHPKNMHAAGAVTPIDDCGAMLQAMLFHIFWKKCGDARPAFCQACRALLTDDWPEEAKLLFSVLVEELLPSVMNTARQHATIDHLAVARQYPDLSRNQQLALQHKIRRNGERVLSLWQGIGNEPAGPNAFFSMLRQQAVWKSVRNSARYWAWFG